MKRQYFRQARLRVERKSVAKFRDERDISDKAKFGYVYLIKAESSMRFKIGFSIDPVSRVADFATGSPLMLELVAWYRCKNMYREERRWHEYLAEFHHHGEWFELPPDKACHVIEDFLFYGMLPDIIEDLTPELAKDPSVRLNLHGFIADLESYLSRLTDQIQQSPQFATTQEGSK